MSSKLIYEYKGEVLKGVFEVHISVYEVTKSKKFPDGIKLRCVLLDIEAQIPRLLLDNHEPFGYHLHTRLPYDKNHRLKVDVKNYEEAILLFRDEVRKLVKHEI